MWDEAIHGMKTIDIKMYFKHWWFVYTAQQPLHYDDVIMLAGCNQLLRFHRSIIISDSLV